MCYFVVQIDHMARAKRSKEIPLLEKQYEEERVRSKEFWEQQEVARVSLHQVFTIIGFKNQTNVCVYK